MLCATHKKYNKIFITNVFFTPSICNVRAKKSANEKLTRLLGGKDSSREKHRYQRSQLLRRIFFTSLGSACHHATRSLHNTGNYLLTVSRLFPVGVKSTMKSQLYVDLKSRLIVNF